MIVTLIIYNLYTQHGEEDEEEWVLHLDDGVLQDGQWFLSDDPVSLETPTKKILFRPAGRDKDGRLIYGRVIPLRT